MYTRKTPRHLQCDLYLTKEVLNGKWKPNLILAIAEGYRRPSEMQRMLQQATKRVLNLQLKELEKHRIVCKEIFHEIPLRVEYSLTPLGESLLTVIHAMTQWGSQHREFLETVINKGEKSISESQNSLPCQGTSTILP